MNTTDAEIVESGSEIVSAITGEVASEDTQALTVRDTFAGIASGPFTEKQVAELTKHVADEDVEIRPDGMVYLPQSRYRRALNTIFGPGAWAIMPLHDPMVRDNTVVYHGALFINGRFIAEAYGEGKYFETNGNTTFATAIESAKSDCLTRCAKDIGIANDLWDPTFVARWRSEHAVEVWCENQKDKKKKKFWRKRSAPPIDQWPWVESSAASKPRSGESHDDWGRQFDRPAASTHPVEKELVDTLEMEPASDTSAPPAETSAGAWRDVEIHFGKNRGVKLGALPVRSLQWYQNDWNPDPSRTSAADRALKAALEQAKKEAESINGYGGDGLPF